MAASSTPSATASRLAASASGRFSAGLCEMKRLYVEPSQRGFGVGRDLTLAAIKAAKEIGYRKLLLDTLPAMRVAVKLYREWVSRKRQPTTRRRSKARCSSPSI
jgi:ribosomal protein S18 acetylase RimI-like enzyme